MGVIEYEKKKFKKELSNLGLSGKLISKIFYNYIMEFLNDKYLIIFIFFDIIK